MSGIQYQLRGDTRANLALATPAAREIGVVTDKGEMVIGDAATPGGIPLQKKNFVEHATAAQISADQNNYAPAGYDKHCGLLEISSDAARTITGLTGGTTDRKLFIANKGSFNITLKDASGSSTAANRFLFGEDVVIRAGGAIELYYSGTDSRWERASSGVKLASIPEEFLLPGDLTPSQITSNQNDYAPTGILLAATLRLNTDASRNITGIADPRAGRELRIINVGTNPLVLKEADAGSSAAYRFSFGNDLTLAGKQAAWLKYDATDSRWKLLGTTAGAAVAAGAVTAQTLANSAIGVGALVNGYLDWSVSGSALTVALKTLAGTDPTAADPVYALIRSTTSNDGKPTFLTISGALSATLSSGSSAGTTNGVAFKLWALLFNDAGTPRIGLVNTLSGTNIMPIGAWGVTTSTAEGGAGGADNTQTIYTGAAVAAKPYAALGYATWETGLAAAGTWSSGPTRIQAFGPGVLLPGHVVQNVRTQSTSYVTGSTAIPFDNTIPQSTEGDQYMSATIFLVSAANLLNVAVSANLGHSAGPAQMVAALFQDSATDACAASTNTATGAGYFCNIAFVYRALCRLTTSTTFKFRAGSPTAGTYSINGIGSTGNLGGVIASSFIDTSEIQT